MREQFAERLAERRFGAAQARASVSQSARLRTVRSSVGLARSFRDGLVMGFEPLKHFAALL
jgi:hypothetical protein